MDRSTVENLLIAARKGSGGSGNWGHSSESRTGKVGGSDPGGGLGKIGVAADSSAQERQAAAQEHRTGPAPKEPETPKTSADYQGMILDALGDKIKGPRAKDQRGAEYVTHAVLSRAERGELLPRDLYAAAYGLQYARDTGRLSGTTEMAIRKLPDHATVRLLSDITAEGLTIAQVPDWLNRNSDKIQKGYPGARGASKPKRAPPTDIMARAPAPGKEGRFYVATEQGARAPFKSITGYTIQRIDAPGMNKHEIFAHREPGGRYPWAASEGRTGLWLPFGGRDRWEVERKVREAFQSGSWSAERLERHIRQEWEEGGEARISPRYRQSGKAAQEALENALTALFIKGGPGSGHYGHAGRPGHRGGSLPRSVAMSVATGKTAQERQQAAAAQGRAAGKQPVKVPQPGDFQTLDDARAWFSSQGMNADLTDITNVEAVNEAARAVRDTLEKFPWMAERVGPITQRDVLDLYYEPDQEFRFMGIGTYSGADTPPKIVDLGGDAFAMEYSSMVWERNPVGGPTIYYNPKSLNRGTGSELYAQIGIVARPNATVYGATVHEMGHAAWDIIGMRGGRSEYNPDRIRWGRAADTFRFALHRAGITDRMIKKNVSSYATWNEKEKFAEIFLVMNTPDAPMSKAFRGRLERFRREYNKELGWEAL